MIETVFYTTSGGFPMSAILGLCAISALFAMILVAWRDCISFEIDFALLGAAALAMASVILITAGPEALPGALVAAAIAATASWIAWRWKPGRLGLGDIRLMGFVGFAAGPDHAVPVLAALCLFCALTAACYSHIRGKKLFRSMFPAALPGMGAAVVTITAVAGRGSGAVRQDGTDNAGDQWRRAGFGPDRGGHHPHRMAEDIMGRVTGRKTGIGMENMARRRPDTEEHP